MARKKDNVVIAGTNYEITLLPTSQSFELLIDTVKIVGPTAGPLVMSIFEAVSTGKLDSVLEVDLHSLDLNKVAREFCTGLDKAQLKSIAKLFAGVTIVEGEGLLANNYEQHFLERGQFAHLQWLIAVYKVQFSDFFDALSMKLGGAKVDQKLP